jgi:hypothetical protein
MHNGWFRMHRKFLDNRVFMYYPTAWRVFETLLALADANGNWAGGRNQLSVVACTRSGNTYKALKRLEKEQMVTLSSNNRFTTIHICNWGNLQQYGNTKREHQSNNRVTTKEHSYKNKEYKNKELIKDDLFTKTFNEFAKMRKTLRKPLTERGAELIRLKLEKFAPDDVPMQIAILERSIENSWQGVFEINQNASSEAESRSGWLIPNKKT